LADALEPAEFGRYRLLRLLGKGGMAEVHLAETVGPQSLRRRVAIKRLLPAFATSRRYVQMLLDEAHIVGGIHHPNVAQLLDYGQVGPTHYIALEFVQGVDLACVLRTLRARGFDLPVPVALHVGRCVARGLHAAHTLVDAEGRPMRVVHRDVSPHNVLLSQAGEVKLIDFGVAKAETNLTTTRTGIIKGKLQYMSPEQAQARPVDRRADVFSLGMTLYKMLVGHLPFSGSNEFEIYDEILRKRATPPSHLRSDVPERVDALVLRALQKSADDRFQTAEEMARVIDRALTELAPAFDAPDVARFLAQDVPTERPASAEENDDFRRVAETSGAFAAATSWDAARIERLTRMDEQDGLVPTVRAAVGGPAGTVATVLDEEPPGTLILQPSSTATMTSRGARPGEAGEAPPQTEPSSPAGGGETSTPSSPVAGDSVLDAPLFRSSRFGWAVLGLLGFLSAILMALQFGGPEPDVEQVVVRRVVTAPSDSPPPLTEAPRQPSGPSTPPVAALPPADVPAPAAPSVAASPIADVPAAPSVAASPPADVPAPAAPSVAAIPAVAPARAYLTVSTLPWAWVYLDGTKLARHTPLVSVPVKPGRHRLRLETGDGRSHGTEIMLRPGQRLTISHAFE
jgi:serine/threonine protein kinase